ncbi:MAG: glycosyltransferase [Selenomonadaceae bacterium]|nr:glycosyltransferase [Selenomonadaceae bacterium]
MRFAIMESVVTPGGHEIDFDRILVEELTALGHSVEFYVPTGHEFKWNYGVPVHHLPGSGVSYRGTRGLKKLALSLKRELHRQGWYRALHTYALSRAFDAVIFPSATYRYLRALRFNPLRHSPVPVLFLIHGATPSEAQLLKRAAQRVAKYPHIRIGVQTFAADKLQLNGDNMRLYAPPNYIPRDISPNDYQNKTKVLRLGFFGQYRREKKLEPFLDAFAGAKFNRAVRLIVQGATQTPEDAAAFADIMTKYRHVSTMEFWANPLIGVEWQKALAGIDAIVIAYGGERYRYHTSALISNAMGYQKPILAVDNVNPEILAQYKIGLAFPAEDDATMRHILEDFVNNFDEQRNTYKQELARTYRDFSPMRMAENIVALAQ